jgi:hypothetical protein
MIKEYQISNFKAFAGPVSVPIKPITLIFGPNSSGKSSILQSLLMLKQSVDEAASSAPCLVCRGDLVDVGSYREFIHRHDISRSFSFKITVPADLDALFDNVGDFFTPSSSFKKLEKSIDFDKIGLNIEISYDPAAPGIIISRIELYLGDDPSPILTYGPEVPPEVPADKDGYWARRAYERSPGSFLRVKGVNLQHKYWVSYLKALDEQDPKHIEKLPVAGEISIKDIASKFQNLTDDERETAIKLMASLGINIPGVEGPDLPQDKFGRALEAYDIDNADDFILLEDFLPQSLNGHDPEELVDGDRNSSVYSGRISLFTFAASILFRTFLQRIFYLGPIRHYSERYPTVSGIKTHYVGKTGKYVPDILISNKQLLNDVNKELDRFGMGYELKVDRFSAQLSDIDDSFLCLYEKSTGVHAGFTDVGFGVSQVLPIIVQSLLSKGKNLLIEQPELHLHPRLQAELGDLFIDSALGDSKNTLIIETHSEHLLLRIMRRIRETTSGRLPERALPVRPGEVAVLFVEPSGSHSVIHEMPINEKGDLVKLWPGGFFEEDFRELF